jgi:hypothetical protein
VHPSRLNADEHIRVADLGPIDLLEPQDVRGLLAVGVLDDRPHPAARRHRALVASSGSVLDLRCHDRSLSLMGAITYRT